MNDPMLAGSDQINEIATALAKAQAMMRPAPFNRVNFFKQKYADLNSIIEAAREPLSANGLCMVQQLQPTSDGTTLIARLIHTSGQWLASYYQLPAVNMKAQEFGSHLTYARRYTYAALVGMSADEDDDGDQGNKEGSAHGHKPPKPAPRIAPPAKPERVDPETGELGDGEPTPLEITEPDPERWGQQMISDATFAKDELELDMRMKANIPHLRHIENEHPKIYRQIKQAVERKRTALRALAEGVKP